MQACRHAHACTHACMSAQHMQAPVQAHMPSCTHTERKLASALQVFKSKSDEELLKTFRCGCTSTCVRVCVHASRMHIMPCMAYGVPVWHANVHLCVRARTSKIALACMRVIMHPCGWICACECSCTRMLGAPDRFMWSCLHEIVRECVRVPDIITCMSGCLTASIQMCVTAFVHVKCSRACGMRLRGCVMARVNVCACCRLWCKFARAAAC